jgi:endonuclease YncB( thermonuclease family)
MPARRDRSNWAAALALCFLATKAAATPWVLEGRVVGVSDGDTITVLDSEWWFRRYADEQSPEDRGRYASEEEEARLRKRGLWVDPKPVPPWEWRESRPG